MFKSYPLYIVVARSVFRSQMGTFFTDRRFSHGDGTVVLFPESKALEHTNFTGTAYNNLVYSMVSNKRPYAYVVL